MSLSAIAVAAMLFAAADEMPERSPGESLTPAQLAGQRMIFGFNGTEAPRDLLRRIRRGEAAGVILFRRNIRSRAQVRRMTSAFQRWRPPGDPPLLVTIDQEGGIVKRLAGAPTRSARELGYTSLPFVAREEGRATAKNLRGVGVNVNLAPVVDLGRPGRIMREQGRAWSSSPGKVGRMAAAFARGLREGGVAATAKHFPGLGGAQFDQDRQMNTITLSAERLRAEDYAPFEQLTKAGVELVMTSTAMYPALDSSRPAVFSPRVLDAELRGRVGFHGVTITDSLGTESATRFGTPERRALRAARAGNDLLLFASSYAAGVRGARKVAEAIEDGTVVTAPSTGRVDPLRRTLSWRRAATSALTASSRGSSYRAPRRRRVREPRPGNRPPGQPRPRI